MNGPTRFSLSLGAPPRNHRLGNGRVTPGGARRPCWAWLQPAAVGRRPAHMGASAPLKHHGPCRCPAHAPQYTCRTPGGPPRVGSLAGAARLLKRNAGVRRWAQAGRKPAAEHKGKSPPDPAGQWPVGMRKHGLTILRCRVRRHGGDRKVTTGITGLWPPSDHSDVAFWFFDVGSSYRPEAEFWERRIVHPCKGTWAGFRPSRDRLVLSYRGRARRRPG